MKTEARYLNQFNRIKLYFLSVLSVFFGGMVYILLRPEKAQFFDSFDDLGISEITDWLREFTVPASRFFPDWLVYALPNGLWAFAYTLLILTIWKENNSTYKYIWYISIPVLIFGFEFMQLTDNISGTFAFGDVISGFAGIVFGIFTIKSYHNEENNVK